MTNRAFRLFVVLLLLLAILPKLSHAEAPVTKAWYYFGDARFATVDGVCNAAMAVNAKTATHWTVNPSGAYCLFYDASENYQGYWSLGTITEARCSDGTAPDTTKPLADQCGVLPPNCTDLNPFVIKFAMSAGGAFPGQYQNCAITVDSTLVCRTETVSGKATSVCMLQIRRTGDAAQSSTDVPKAATPLATAEDKTAPRIPMPATSGSGSLCPGGTVQGGFDSSGIAICIGSGSVAADATTAPTTTTKPPTTTSNLDGSTTTSQSVSVSNKDGSITTTVTNTLVAADGSKTLSQTATTSNSAAGTAGTPDKDGFCVQNPTLAICQNSSVSGDCEAVTCTGDAIQCATLRSAAAMNCRSKQDAQDIKDSPLTSFGDAVVAGNDPEKVNLPSVDNAQVVQVPTTLDTSGFLGAGSYFADKTFTVQGHTITIPLSKTESIMLVFRYALMLVASLVSFKIIRTAVLS